MLSSPYTVIAVVGLTACIIDLRTRRIPNVLTFSAAAAGLVYHTALGGWDGFATASLGWVAGLLLFLPLFLLRGMGAGDVKLLAAFGALLGPQLTLVAALAAAIIGGIAALLLIVMRRRVVETTQNIHHLLRFWMTAGLRPAPGLVLGCADTVRLAYALPITAGALATIWLQ